MSFVASAFNRRSSKPFDAHLSPRFANLSVRKKSLVVKPTDLIAAFARNALRVPARCHGFFVFC